MSVFTGYFERYIQVEIKDGQQTVMKNGMKAIKGICPDCGTKVFLIMGKKYTKGYKKDV